MTTERRPVVVDGPVPTPVGGPSRRPDRFRDAATRRRVLRRRRQVAGVLVTMVLAVVVRGCLALAQVGGAPPMAAVRWSLPPTRTVTSTATPLPWAPSGQSAVAVPAAGFTEQSGPEQPVPVASLTKIMTAYVVLHDHPLRPGRSGPTILVTPADAQDFATDTVTDQANVPLRSGETLTELQMLEGLLVHSADDLAFSLANWDAGSVAAFVGKMNTTASRLGMARSHFADASGFDPASVSTAADILKVAAAGMRIPVFAHIVTLRTVSLPTGASVPTYTPMLGTPGVVGVKSGFTTAAGGADVLAYRMERAGRAVTALAAVTSQEGPTVLQAAGQQALALATAAAVLTERVQVVAAGRRVGTATVDGRSVALVVAHPVLLDVVPGTTIRQSVIIRRRPRGGDHAATVVGTATFGAGTQRVRVTVRTAAALPRPPLLQRLF